MSRSYKTAGICFLGVGDCDPNVGFGKADDYKIDTEAQCKNEGFSKQNCNSVQTIDGVCPYNAAYGLGCKCRPDLISCPAGQVGVGESCDEMYASCECDPALVSCSAKENGTGASCGADMKAASASRNINILLPTVLIRVRCPGTAAADNIPTASVRPGLTKGRTAAPNIILLPVLRSARWLTPTTAISGKA